jgi:hypothetical protein
MPKPRSETTPRFFPRSFLRGRSKDGASGKAGAEAEPSRSFEETF